MIPSRITRKLRRLRAAIIKEMTRITEANARLISGVTCSRALSERVVLDSPTEEHLRVAKSVHVGLDGVLYVEVFDNYDESTREVPAENIATDSLLDILNRM